MFGRKVSPVALFETRTSTTYKRDVAFFYGDSIVLGCGDVTKHGMFRNPSPHTDKERFYTLDTNASTEPDCIHNLDRGCPTKLHGRFNFVLVEYLPFSVHLYRPDAPEVCPINQSKIKQSIFDFMAEEAVLLIEGGLPFLSHNEMIYESYQQRLPHEDAPDSGYGLLVKGPAGISPALIVASLNPSAFALIASRGFVLEEMKNAEADQQADNDFIRVKAVEIINRQVERLAEEQKTKFSPLKEQKIQGLSRIKKEIEQSDQSLSEIITTYNSSTISSGFFRSLTKEDLQTICQLEKVFLSLYELKLDSNPAI